MSNYDEIDGSKYVEGINEHNMDQFLKALRSGEYGQTAGQLCYMNAKGEASYCCLGVASELAAQDGAVEKTGALDGIRNGIYDGRALLAPLGAMDWLGIPEDNRHEAASGEYNIKFFKTGLEPNWENFVSASEMNDDRKFNFSQIADVFENEFKKESN